MLTLTLFESEPLHAPQRVRSRYVEVFFIAFFTALSFLLPYMILDHGVFLFFGDYCVQQVPFYSLAHDAIRSGSWGWNWNTDLGANFIGSYAFYLLGSPFFWLTIPLPSVAVPYTLGPLLAIKIGVSAVTSCAYISRFTKRREYAVLGGLIYALSSYSVYNIFFNHFHEPMAFFPLLLIGLEEFMQKDRKGIFAFTVFINAIVNYNFFAGEVVFVIIYWIIRMLSGDWKISVKKYLLLAFEAVLGFAMSCVLIVPAVLAITGNYRTTEMISGWNMLVYDWPQRYFDIIHSVFFPQDLPSQPNFFPDTNANWASVAAWFPMFSMVGVLAFLSANKGTWLRRIIMTCFVFALVPVLNSAFVLFNSSYYGRWFYMGILMMALATIKALENPQTDYKPSLKLTFAITLAFAAIGLIPKFENKKFVQLGLEANVANFWSFFAIAVLGLIVLWRILKAFKIGTTEFANYATIGFIIISCIYGNVFISTGKTYGWDGTWFKSTAIEGASKIKIDRSKFCRIDVINGIDNQGMFWRIPTINAFQSVVPPSIMDFYNTVGVQRDVGSRPSIQYAALRPLLSVKYAFDPGNLTTISMPGWKKVGVQLGFGVWENENFIPMGFTYDSYITQKQFDASPSKDRVLLKGILLSDSQIKKYPYLSNLDEENADYSDDAMANDCAARRKTTCSSFSYDNSGFNAIVTLKSKNLVFFTVPYESGWTATVNGQKATIEKVNIGFMAVECPSGTSTIRFYYQTPGLKLGAAITGGSVTIFALYLLLIFWLKKRRVKALYGSTPNNALNAAMDHGNSASITDSLADAPPANAPPADTALEDRQKEDGPDENGNSVNDGE